MQPPIRVAVTGTEEAEGIKARALVLATLIRVQTFAPVAQFVTGAAHGIDSMAFYDGLAQWSEGTEHVVVYPSGLRHNEEVAETATDLAAQGRRSVRVIACTQGYMARNDLMLDTICAPPAQDRLLLAFPKTRTEQQRSGTWATVRRARKRGIPILYTPLDSGIQWVEHDGCADGLETAMLTTKLR